jgi:hypothetical protein
MYFVKEKMHLVSGPIYFVAARMYFVTEPMQDDTKLIYVVAALI